jgi:hypothetical protein
VRTLDGWSLGNATPFEADHSSMSARREEGHG